MWSAAVDGSLIVAIVAAAISLGVLLFNLHQAWRASLRRVNVRVDVNPIQTGPKRHDMFIEVWVVNERPRPLEIHKVEFHDAAGNMNALKHEPAISSVLPKVLNDGEGMVLRYRPAHIVQADTKMRELLGSGGALTHVAVTDAFGKIWLAPIRGKALGYIEHLRDGRGTFPIGAEGDAE